MSEDMQAVYYKEDLEQEAQQAFWTTIAEAHPEITTGDFPPDAAFAFDEACSKAYKIWLEGNTPKGIFNLNPDKDLGSLHGSAVKPGDVMLHANKRHTRIILPGLRYKSILCEANGSCSVTESDYTDDTFFFDLIGFVRDGADILFNEFHGRKLAKQAIGRMPRGGVSDLTEKTEVVENVCKIDDCSAEHMSNTEYCLECWEKANRYIVVTTDLNLYDRGITDEQLAMHCYDIYANMANGPLDGDDLGGCGGSVYKTCPTITDNDKETNNG